MTRGDPRLPLLALALVACGGGQPGPRAAGLASNDSRLEVAGVGDALPFVVGSRHGNAISACAGASDSSVIATGSVDGTLRLWLTSNQPLATFRAHAGRVQSVAFDADSRVVATASEDGTAAAFRLSDGKALGRARVVFSQLPAALYGSSDGSTKSSWQLEFRGSELWLINVASFDPGSPAQERRLGKLVADGFEFSDRRGLLASHRDSPSGRGKAFFSCALEGYGLLRELADPAPWSRMLTSSRRHWLAVSRLKSNDPREDEELWSLLPVATRGEPLTFVPSPGRLQGLIDDVLAPLAVVRTETIDPRAASWSLQRLSEAKPLASFQTSTDAGAFAAGAAHVFYSTPEQKLAVADFAGASTAWRLPDASDVRVVAVAPDEKLVAYATEVAVVVWSLAAGAELAHFDGEPFVHVEALEFGASSTWLLVNSRNKVSAVDLRRAHARASAVPLALESENFRAPAVLEADLTSVRDQLLVGRQGALLLAQAGSTDVAPAMQDASPQAQWALAQDGVRLVEARAVGDLVIVEPTTGSRWIANPVGAPRALKWLTNDVVAVLGDAGVALLNASGRTLQIDTVGDDGAGLLPFAFDSCGATYAGSAAALRHAYRPHWPPRAPATPLAEVSQTVPALIASLIAESAARTNSWSGDSAPCPPR